MTAPEPPSPESLINTRIRLRHEPAAFVRYAGKIPNRNALYVALQWDSESRGKKHTTVDDVQVFPTIKSTTTSADAHLNDSQQLPADDSQSPVTTQYGSDSENQVAHSSFSFIKWSTLETKIKNELQNSGLFENNDTNQENQSTTNPNEPAAPQQLASFADLEVQYDMGRTIGDAIQHRYMVDIRDGKVSWREHTSVELVGMQQVSKRYFQRLDRLNVVSVNHQGVSRIGNLTALANSLETLDLSCNLFNSWEEVLKVFPQVPKLKILMLSGNRFDQLDKIPQFAQNLRDTHSGGNTDDSSDESQAPLSPPPYTHLETLVLNGTLMNWNDSENLVQELFPNLKELHLCDNYISTISHKTEDDAKWESMEHVNLMNNDIDSWSEICKLSTMPSLARINLRRNPIDSISAPAEGEFPSLKSLSLEQTKISTWKDVDALNLFPALSDVRLQGTPLEKKVGHASARIFTIARVAKLVTMNGSTINKRERVDAEKYYLRTCADAKQRLIEQDRYDAAQFKDEHPRYDELTKKHGSFEDFVHKEEKKPTAMKQSLVHVLIKNMSSGVSDATMHMEKRLTPSLRVIDLKKMCQRKWKLHADLQRLYFTPDPENLFPEELEDDNQTISFYGVRSGGIILMEERDLEKEKREKEERERDEQERERQHKEHLDRMERERDF